MTNARRSAGTSDRCKSAGPLGRPLVGKLNGGLCEVRTTFDKNEYRVFFYVEREQVVVVHSTMVLGHGISTRRPRRHRWRTSRWPGVE
ncbi:MAG TPA: type II toxin-antitoxin system RelE/ParE family toxin [Polyangia bacterium]|nr:type II toxin-antitoxin system RelE/ParE family toxin [Polyangia bacterium]